MLSRVPYCGGLTVHHTSTLASALATFCNRGTIRRNLRLYFSEVGAQMHGPMFFAQGLRVEQIQQWLEEETFYSRCKFDEETN